MKDENYISAIESILFFWADPIDLSSLAKILAIDEKQVKVYIESLDKRYEEESFGIEIKHVNDSYQLVTKAKNSNYIEKLTVNIDEKSLSDALMETLSIIAYKQPITRVEIDSIRGVNCSSSITSLIDRGLIKELGKLDRIGKPIIYGTTDEFLRVFALKTLDDLPSLEERIESSEKIDED